MHQRKNPRYQVEAPAVMRVQGRGPFVVTILDVSTTGVRVSSPSEFPAGTRVNITCGGAQVAGEIRYSRQVEREFHVGVLADGASAGAISETGEVDLMRLFQHHLRRT